MIGCADQESSVRREAVPLENRRRRHGRNMPQLAQVRGLCGRIRPSFRVHVNMALICMSKQSEAPKIGDGENVHLRHEVSPSHTPRTLDRAYVRFLTESAIIHRHHCTATTITRIFSSETMPRYRLLAARGTPLLAPRATLSCSVHCLIMMWSCCSRLQPAGSVSRYPPMA